jgi:hypothetical protein
VRILPLFAALLIAPVASGEDLAKYSVVKFAYGATSVDFSADGNADLVVVGRRENFNAHGFDVASFYIRSPDSEGSREVWNIVPLEADGKEVHQVTSSGGADCLLHDFRLLKGKQKNEALLVLADRDFGETYVDEEKVTFTFYALKVNDGQQLGSADFYFEKSSSQVAKKKYCDVREAFKSELGLSFGRSSD